MKAFVLTAVCVALALVILIGLVILRSSIASQQQNGYYTIICANKWTGDQGPYYIVPGMADRCPSDSYRVP